MNTNFCLASLTHPTYTWRPKTSQRPRLSLWRASFLRGLWSAESCRTHLVRKTDRLSKGSKKGNQYIQFLLFCQVLLYDALAFGRTGFLYFPGWKKYSFLKHSCQSKTQFKLQYKTQALFSLPPKVSVWADYVDCVKSRTVGKARVLTSKHFCVASNLAHPYFLLCPSLGCLASLQCRCFLSLLSR